MADKTIVELPAITAPTGAGVLPIDSGTETFKVTVADLAAVMPPYILPIAAVTAGATAVTQKRYHATTSAGTVTFNLPDPATIVSGFAFEVRDVSGVAGDIPMTAHRFATEKIEGVAADFSMAANFGTWRFEFDGTNWFVK